MKTIMVVLFAGLLSLTLFAQSDLNKVKGQIQKANQEMSKAMVDNDGDALLSLYLNDAVSLPNNRPMMKGKDALKKDFENMKDWKTKKAEFNTQEVFGDGKYYYEVGSFDVDFVNPETKNVENDKGKYMTIWEVQGDGSVKVKADMWNRDKSKEMNNNNQKNQTDKLKDKKEKTE